MKSKGTFAALLVLGIAQLALGSAQYVRHNSDGATVSLLCGAALVVVASLRLRKG